MTGAGDNIEKNKYNEGTSYNPNRILHGKILVTYKFFLVFWKLGERWYRKGHTQKYFPSRLFESGSYIRVDVPSHYILNFLRTHFSYSHKQWHRSHNPATISYTLLHTPTTHVQYGPAPNLPHTIHKDTHTGHTHNPRPHHKHRV